MDAGPGLREVAKGGLGKNALTQKIVLLRSDIRPRAKECGQRQTGPPTKPDSRDEAVRRGDQDRVVTEQI